MTEIFTAEDTPLYCVRVTGRGFLCTATPNGDTTYQHYHHSDFTDDAAGIWTIHYVDAADTLKTMEDMYTTDGENVYSILREYPFGLLLQDMYTTHKTMKDWAALSEVNWIFSTLSNLLYGEQ